MKTDKEYPATHSMSTAWYIVDDDGNVGILDYNENGPVPTDIPECGIEELVWGLPEDCTKFAKLPIKLTTKQVYENMPKPHSPNEEGLWYDCIVKIDNSKKERFIQLCKGNEIDGCVCLSDEEGIYFFDAFSSTDYIHDNYGKILPNSPLDIIIKENIIHEVYRINYYLNNDTYNKEKDAPEHSKDYDSCSFFIYHQPYWEDFLPQKMSTPKYPVKLSQLSDDLQKKVHHIPGNFNDLDTFQIAEYYPSNITHSAADATYIIDGYEYELLPLPNGSKAYLLSEPSDGQQMKYTLEEFEKLKELGRAVIKKGC